MSDVDTAAGLRIEYRAVSKFYGDVLGVNRVTLALESGITGLVGPNGSGKTTWFRALLGLTPPVAGRIAWAQVRDPAGLRELAAYGKRPPFAMGPQGIPG